MADYIDRKDVLDALAKLYAFYGEKVILPDGRMRFMNHADTPQTAIAKAGMEVMNLPVPDVVPVIRCKDCVHYKKFPWGDEMVCMNFEYYLYTEPNDFCSCGEPKLIEK